MPTKRRTYNTRLIRKGYSYYVEDVAERFGVHKNVVRNWIKQGLKTIDGKRPAMVHGSELAEFLDQRQQRRKRACQPDEFFCCKCRQPRQAWERLVDLTELKKGSWMVKAICAVCSTNMRQIAPARNLPKLQELFTVQTVNGEHITESFNPLVMCDFNQGGK